MLTAFYCVNLFQKHNVQFDRLFLAITNYDLSFRYLVGYELSVHAHLNVSVCAFSTKYQWLYNVMKYRFQNVDTTFLCPMGEQFKKKLKTLLFNEHEILKREAFKYKD